MLRACFDARYIRNENALTCGLLPERWDVSFEAAANNEGSPAKRGCRGRNDAAGVRRGWQGRESREAGVHCREQGRAAGEALDLHK